MVGWKFGVKRIESAACFGWEDRMGEKTECKIQRVDEWRQESNRIEFESFRLLCSCSVLGDLNVRSNLLLLMFSFFCHDT